MGSFPETYNDPKSFGESFDATGSGGGGAARLSPPTLGKRKKS